MLTRKEIENYQKLLSDMLTRVQGNVGEVRADALQKTGAEPSGGLSNVPLHPADLANRQFEEEVSLKLVVNEEHLLGEIDAALARIEDGRFGRCENCQKAISKERLHVLPYTRFCATCARQQESSEREG